MVMGGLNDCCWETREVLLMVVFVLCREQTFLISYNDTYFSVMFGVIWLSTNIRCSVMIQWHSWIRGEPPFISEVVHIPAIYKENAQSSFNDTVDGKSTAKSQIYFSTELPPSPRFRLKSCLNIFLFQNTKFGSFLKIVSEDLYIIYCIDSIL